MKAPRSGTQPMGWVKESILRKQLPIPVIASLWRETQAEGLAGELPFGGVRQESNESVPTLLPAVAEVLLCQYCICQEMPRSL